MKSERFEARGLWIDTNFDMNGRYWTVWKPNTTQIFRDSKEMLRWISWPPKTQTGDSLRSWISSIQAADAERKQRPAPVGDANVPHSFDPLAHESTLDDSDPNHATRTIV
jgi:hypothetical protein